jgi:hypothetical protein
MIARVRLAQVAVGGVAAGFAAWGIDRLVVGEIWAGVGLLSFVAVIGGSSLFRFVEWSNPYAEKLLFASALSIGLTVYAALELGGIGFHRSVVRGAIAAVSASLFTRIAGGYGRLYLRARKASCPQRAEESE